MEAVEILKREHEVIDRVLTLIGLAVARIEGSESPPDGFEEWTIGFFRNFADRCHHAKEEDILFPLLEQRGVPRDGGPIGVMLHEHEQGRAYLKTMEHALQASPVDEAAYAKAAFDYGTLLAQHIFKENNVLFEMAKQCLTEQDEEQILKHYAAAESEQGGESFHAETEAEVKQWEQAFSK